MQQLDHPVDALAGEVKPTNSSRVAASPMNNRFVILHDSFRQGAGACRRPRKGAAT
jgi:hypothetical protein